jgi:hypothetical protein
LVYTFRLKVFDQGQARPFESKDRKDFNFFYFSKLKAGELKWETHGGISMPEHLPHYSTRKF